MKLCCRCLQTKPLEEFNKKSANKDGLERYCKDCHRTKNRQHYKDNKQSYIDSSKRFRNNYTEWWKEFKSSFKCTRCGEDKPWRLSFHHLDPAQKEYEISTMLVSRKSREAIQQEINKCIPVCHNCHADIHYEQRIR